MKAVILAGGRGRRLETITDKRPKPMVKIGGKTLLEHHFILLKKHGIKNVYICTGYRSKIIEDYFGDGKKLGIKIAYSIEDKPLGSAGCIKELEDKIKKDFLVLCGDVVLDMNLSRLIKFHRAKKGIGTLVVHPNDHPYDSDLIDIDSNHRITAFLNKPHKKRVYYHNVTNAGVYVLAPAIFKLIKKDSYQDFGRDVFLKIVDSRKRIYAYNTPEYLKDAGTPERLSKVRKDYLSGKINRFNLKHKRPAVFLDRDGVINKEVDLLHKLSGFELLPDTARAIRLINDSDFYSIVVTNQPVVARGLARIEDVENINKKMETLLGAKGAKLDAIYYCPHHPDSGFKGENKKYKVNCNCRKPKTGLIKKALKDFNIDLSKSIMIGDSTCDIRMGLNAGLKTIGVRTGYGCKDGKYAVSPNVMSGTLFQAVKKIVKGAV